MSDPSWPEWGAEKPQYFPWHTHTGPSGDMHAGYLLDTVIAPDVATGKERIYEVLRCEPCISIHVTPLPDPDALAHYYATQFYQVQKPDYLERYEHDRHWWEWCVHEPLLHHALAALPLLQHPPAILEIGAGPGIALDVTQRMGFETHAIEPSSVCAELLRSHGHCVMEHTFEYSFSSVDIVDIQGCFDIVYLYEVLEHQPCPEAFLLHCYELLAPGGVMVICVPNDYSPMQLEACTKLGLPHYWLAPPQHLFYFSPKFLQLLVRRCGFEIFDIRGTYPLEQFLLQGLNYIGNDVIGREIHQIRMQDELRAIGSGHWSVREEQYRRNMAEKRLGREIVCLARKN